MRIFDKILSAAAASVLALSVTTTVSAQEYTMKIGHVAAVTQPLFTCAEVLKSHVETASGGRIAVEHFPAGQLGNFRQNIEQLQLETLEVTLTSGGGISNVFPPIQAFDIPYLFSGDRVIENVMNDPDLNARLRADVLAASDNVRLLGMTGGVGWRDFFSTKPVKTAADLEGVKMRTIESPVAIELVRTLGMNPTPVAWPELYTSLATGVVEGTKNSLSDVVDTNLHDFVKYTVQDHHTHTIVFWWIADKWLQNLPDDLQVVVLDGFHALKTTCNGMPGALNLEKQKKFLDSGGVIHVPSEEEMATFLPGQKPVLDWFVGEFGSEYYDLVKAAADRAAAAVAADRAAVSGN